MKGINNADRVAVGGEKVLNNFDLPYICKRFRLYTNE